MQTKIRRADFYGKKCLVSKMMEKTINNLSEVCGILPNAADVISCRDKIGTRLSDYSHKHSLSHTHAIYLFKFNSNVRVKSHILLCFLHFCFLNNLLILLLLYYSWLLLYTDYKYSHCIYCILKRVHFSCNRKLNDLSFVIYN